MSTLPGPKGKWTVSIWMVLEDFLEEGEMGPAGERGGEYMHKRMYLPPLERVRGSTELGNQLLAAPWAPWPLCFVTPSM